VRRLVWGSALLAVAGCGALISLDAPSYVPSDAGAVDGAPATTDAMPDAPPAPAKPERLGPADDGLVFGLRADDDYLYYASFDRWSLTRLAKDGGSRLDLLPEGGVQEPTSVWLRDGFVYYTAYGAGDSAPFRHGFRRIAVDGGDPLTIDACNTFFSAAVETDRGFAVTASCGDAVRVRRYERGVDGGPIVTTDTAPDTANMYAYATYGWSDDDPTRFYWVNAGEVRVIAKDFLAGASATTLAAAPAGAGSFLAIRVDDRVYVLTKDRLLAVDKTTGGVTVLASGLENAAFRSGIALDATHVYFTQSLGGFVSRVPRAGGARENLASDQVSPSSVAVDDQFVYWTTAGNGGVWRIKK